MHFIYSIKCLNDILEPFALILHLDCSCLMSLVFRWWLWKMIACFSLDYAMLKIHKLALYDDNCYHYFFVTPCYVFISLHTNLELRVL
jgi:hypothetical protein